MTETSKPKLKIPSHEELIALGHYHDLANQAVASAIKRICKIQKWTPERLSKCIQGVPASTWSGYRQQKYPRPRHLHVLSALSWLCQISMNAFYVGENLEQHWPGVDPAVFDCITNMGLLPTEQFEYLMRQILSKLERAGYDKREGIEQGIAKLSQYTDDDFLIPKTLNMELFRQDYYQSISRVLREFREEHQLSEETMAIVFDMSDEKYAMLEDINTPVDINIGVGLRLKLGFKLERTVSFTKYMKHFKGFYFSRLIQEERELIIINCLSDVDDKTKSHVKELAYRSMLFHQE